MCKFRIEDRCTFDICDQYIALVSESYCEKCPYNTEIYGFNEEKVCCKCSYYCERKDSNFFGQCIRKGVKGRYETCVEWKRKVL